MNQDPFPFKFARNRKRKVVIRPLKYKVDDKNQKKSIEKLLKQIRGEERFICLEVL